MKKIIAVLLIGTGLLMNGTSAPAPARTGEARVLVVPIRGAINPPMTELLRESVDRAHRQRIETVVLEINTPGGLLTSTREMVEIILNSPVPVVAYVSPRGAQCASAGTFIALACPVLAMSPGSNIGAARPVDMTGQMDEQMSEKVINDAVAWITSLAGRWERNEEWAEKAVRESASVNEKEAVEINVADLVAGNLSELLELIHHREINLEDETIILNTRHAEVERVELTFRQKILQTISNPNIAYILLLLGILGIMAEFSSPGIGFAGVVGSICLILGFYAMATLPVTITGLALIFVAVAFFILEAYTPTFGLLGLGGLAALFFASVFLLRPFSYLRFSRVSFYSASLIFAGLVFGIATFALRAQRRKVTTGPEGLVGETGTCRTALNPEGTVYVHGEYWTARALTPPVKKGAKVTVQKVDGHILLVEKKPPDS